MGHYRPSSGIKVDKHVARECFARAIDVTVVTLHDQRQFQVPRAIVLGDQDVVVRNEQVLRRRQLECELKVVVTVMMIFDPQWAMRAEVEIEHPCRYSGLQ